MRKNRILVLIVSLWASIYAIDTYAASQWYMITDTGVKIEMTNVDYLMRTDNSTKFSVVLKNGNPVTGVSSVSFDQQISTGNHNPVIATKVHFYPNPVNDHLCVSGVPTGNRIEIVSLQGKVLKSVKSKGMDIILSVADLPQGIYLLRTASTTLKFIKY